MSDNKTKAVDFLHMVVSGKITEAYERYVDMKGKHHNLYFAAGFPSLLIAMKEAHDQEPNKKFTIKNVLADNDLVAVHSHLVFSNGMNLITMHMFRFKNSKVVEMWDFGQEIPKNLVNKDGAF